jgi:hypothetical protein
MHGWITDADADPDTDRFSDLRHAPIPDMSG